VSSRRRGAPAGLGGEARRLWTRSVAEFDLAEHEYALLEQACKTLDRIAELDADVVARGLMLESSQGLRVHPAIGEARQQRLTLARLLATLGIPPLEGGDDLPKSRGVRGVYGGRK
jgi:phage terminase small subunit